MRISAKDQYQTTRIGTNTMDVQNQMTSDGDQKLGSVSDGFSRGHY